MPSTYARHVSFSFVMLALACGAGVARSAPPPPAPPKTTFLPSRDLLPVTNVSGRGTATGGSCHGLVEAALVYKARRDASPERLPPLAEMRAEIEDRFGLDRAEQLLRRLAVAEQHHVYQQTIQRVQTDWSKRTVFENLKTSLDAGQPVRLSLASESGAGHIVVAYDYTRDADGDFVFKVGDPNHPTDDTRTISYVLGDPGAPIDSEARRGAFEAYGPPGRELEVFAVQAPLERQPERLVEMIEEVRQGTVPQSDLVPPPGLELREEEQATGTADPQVGGVLLSFPTRWYDPAILPDADYERVVGELRRFMRGPGDGGVIVRREERREELVLVPIADLLAPGTTTLGPLTRVRGWVVAGGRLRIVGLVEPGRPPIPLALLSEALELIWRRGLTPWVSLDPDPKDPFGPQHARVGGVTDEHRDGALVRTMLAADYLMKELTLGVRAAHLDGFRSISDLLKAGVGPGAGDEVLFRFWLVPLAAPGADVIVTREGDATAVWLEGHVQVLTENMVRRGGALVGTGARDPVAEATAGDFTAHYDALAEGLPALARLARVFELAKLAALMRALALEDPALAELASRPASSEQSEPLDASDASDPGPPWKGIGPIPVAGTDRVIGGGAHAKARARAEALVASDRLAPLIAAARWGERGPIAVTLPAVLDLQAAAARAASADLSLREALASVREGDSAAALPHLDRALIVDPDDVEALAQRALLRRALHVAGALEDAARAAELDPRLAALRALIAAETDDDDAARKALAEADAVGARFPDDSEVQLMVTLAHLAAADLDGVRARFEALAKVAPFEETTRHVEGLLALLLDGPLTREEAKQRLRLMRAVPLDVQQQAKLGADLIDRDPAEAVRRLDAALALALASPVPAVRELAVPERVRFMRVLAQFRLVGVAAGAGPEERASVVEALREDARALEAAHPDWAGGQVAHLLAADAAGDDEARLTERLRAAVARGGRDPVLAELAVVLDAERPEILLGLMTAWGRAADARTPGAGRALFGACVEGLGDRPIAAALRALSAESSFDLASFLERRGRGETLQQAELDQALAALRRVVAATPAEPSREAIAWWLLPLVFKAYLPLEQEIGEPARIIDAGDRYLRATTAIAGRSPFAEQVLALRGATTTLVAAAIGEVATATMRRDGAGFEVHARALEEAGPGSAGSDAGRLREHLEALAVGMEALVKSSRELVAAALARFGAADGSERSLVALVLALRQRAMGDRSMPRELIAKLRAIPGVGESPELAHLIDATRAVEAGLFLTDPPERLVAEVARLGAVDRVGAETALRALELLQSYVESEDGGAPELGAEVEQVVAELRARIRLGAFVGKATEGESVRESTGGSARARTPWIFIALGAALAAGGLGLWWHLRRPRRNP